MKSWLIWLLVILLTALGVYWVYLTFYQPEPASQEETSQNGETTLPQVAPGSSQTIEFEALATAGKL